MSQIKWHAPTRAKERILAFGIPGSGKTSLYLQILQQVAGNKFVVELDNTLDEFLISPEYEDLTIKAETLNGKAIDDWAVEDGELTLHRIHNNDWKLYIQTLEGLELQPEDWVVIDGAHKGWEWVQDWYMDLVYGHDLGMHLLMARQELIKANKAGHGTNEKLLKEWEPINGEYRKFRRWLINCGCNVILVTGQKKLTDQQTDKIVRAEFGGIGYMPEGQKALASDVRTVLWLQKQVRRDGDIYTVTGVKDRQREKIDVDWTGENMMDVYLKGVAKWKPKVQRN